MVPTRCSAIQRNDIANDGANEENSLKYKYSVKKTLIFLLTLTKKCISYSFRSQTLSCNKKHKLSFGGTA